MWTVIMTRLFRFRKIHQLLGYPILFSDSDVVAKHSVRWRKPPIFIWVMRPTMNDIFDYAYLHSLLIATNIVLSQAKNQIHKLERNFFDLLADFSDGLDFCAELLC